METPAPPPERAPSARAPAAAQAAIFVPPEALHRMLGASGLLVVDVAPADVYAAGHVPGALRLDYSALVDGGEPASGRLPRAQRLIALRDALGLAPETRVVAYDHEQGGRACRLLWTLHVVGHFCASVLNGGAAAWTAEGLPLEAGAAPPAGCGRAPIAPTSDRHADLDYVRSHLHDPGVALLDVRSPAEFDGSDRRAARAGHIPGAVNLDWRETMDPERQHRLRGDETLRGLLAARGIVPEKEIIVYCQTHHRSAHAYVMLTHLGFPRVRGYAGSWSEWGNRDDVPVAR